MGRVADLLAALRPGPVGLDSAIFIYFIERHATYRPLVRPVFEAIDEARLPGVTSALTLLETLVKPLRSGNAEMAERYEELLTTSRGLALVPIDLPLLRLAAELRAEHRLRTPDALQLAAAVAAGCTAFLTNDRRFPSLPSLRVLQLTDYQQL
ncbi:MAG: type II toxin-antitoxin system VapC family toxin [Thermoanaerobaculia bacterium]